MSRIEALERKAVQPKYAASKYADDTRQLINSV